MKKECTEQDLQRFVQDAKLAFEDVTLTELDEDSSRYWQDDGLMVDYELRYGQVGCVLRRQIFAEGKVWELQMTAPLAGSGLPEWADQHRCASLALVALDNADALRAGYGPVVMSQLVCFVANQWKKHFDRPAERVVCRLADSLFVIGCADKNCKELEEELHTLYGQMPHECVASVGLMKMVPIPQSIAVACTSEVRGRNWEAVFQLCQQRLKAVQQAGGDQVSQS